MPDLTAHRLVLLAAWKLIQWERGWWWPKLEKGLAAFIDYHWAELLA